MRDLTSQVDFIEDDVLRLIFLSCHPQLTPESRAALTLRVVGGLTIAEIARAFVVAESPWGSGSPGPRRRSAKPGAEFELPVGAERTDRLDDVMAVIYLIFNEGYTATAGDDWMRPELTYEAIRLAQDARRAGAGRAGGARPAGAAGAAGLARRRSTSTPTVGRCCSRTRTAVCGTSC